MKKVFYIVLAISAALACSKTEVSYEMTDEITISPVNSTVTKSMMSGSEFKGESFNVWAWYSPRSSADNVISSWQKDFEGDAVAPEIYIDEKPFVIKNREKNEWGGFVSYYWPRVGSLVFAGYHAPNLTDGSNGTVDQVTYTFNGGTNQMNFIGVEGSTVVQPQEVNGEIIETFNEDIMYFSMTPNSYNYAYKSVNPSFKHALSWITVTVAKAHDPRIDAKITIKNVSFTKVAKVGTGTVKGASDIEWVPDQTSIEVCDIFDGDDEGLVIEYETNPETGAIRTKVYTLDQHLFIPQDIKGVLQITYEVESTDHSSFTETYRVSLGYLRDQALRHNKWEPAKHYTYNLTIGTDEIRVNPTVETWGAKDTPISIPLPEDWYDKLEKN